MINEQHLHKGISLFNILCELSLQNTPNHLPIKNNNTRLIYTLFIFSSFFPMDRQPLGGLGLLIVRGFAITHFRHTTLGGTPLDEGPARRRDLHLTTHNTHKRQTSMPSAGFKPTILTSERPQTHALDRAATGIGTLFLYAVKISAPYSDRVEGRKTRINISTNDEVMPFC
jgi:hypothetical protein